MSNQEFQKYIKKLQEFDGAVIVEGKKDKQALLAFNIKNIFILNKALYKIVEEISSKYKDVVILTDLDREGRKLYSELSRRLQEHGVRIHNKFREFLFRKTKLRQIEGLLNYLKKEVEYGKNFAAE